MACPNMPDLPCIFIKICAATGANLHRDASPSRPLAKVLAPWPCGETEAGLVPAPTPRLVFRALGSGIEGNGFGERCWLWGGSLPMDGRFGSRKAH